MERLNPMGGTESTQAEPVSGDELAIELGIEAARAEDREVTDAVARAIAAQLHGGQDTALYSLASTGNLEDERLDAELHALYQSTNVRVLEWASVLGTYALHREHRGPVDGWHELWPSRSAPEPPAAEPAAEGNDAEARAALVQRISAAGVTTLGQVATIHTGEGVYGLGAGEEGEHAEPDVYPWRDAAHWQPDGPGESDDEALEELFIRQPDAELGSRLEMGWCGLVKHEGRPGGLVLLENPYGRRLVWPVDSDEELAERWQRLQEEHDAYRYATQARETGSSDSPPRVWVGSLSDYNAGYLHGAWLDATLEPDDLAMAVQFVLRNSHEPDAEEYGIFDYDNFGHGVASLLGEYPSLKAVSRIAQGIAEHGEAFAAWVAYAGETNDEALDRFEDHYLGRFESMEAYVENLLEEGGSYGFLEYVPEWLRSYVRVDVEMLARDMEIEGLHVTEAHEGGVFVFDPRC